MCLEVEDVIFHDPGRNDQQRLGDNGITCRTILNELHQVVAVDDFTRRRGHMGSDLVAVTDRQFLRCQQCKHILGQVFSATNEIRTALAHRGFHNLGIDPWNVGRRRGVENLIDHEPNPFRSFWVHAPHLAGGLTPPQFLSEMRLLPEHQRRLAPCLVLKAPVMWLSMKRERRLCAGERLRDEARIERGNPSGGDTEFRLPSGCPRKMRSPVEPSRRLCVGRQSLCHMRGHCPRDTIPVLE